MNQRKCFDFIFLYCEESIAASVWISPKRAVSPWGDMSIHMHTQRMGELAELPQAVKCTGSKLRLISKFII